MADAAEHDKKSAAKLASALRDMGDITVAVSPHIRGATLLVTTPNQAEPARVDIIDGEALAFSLNSACGWLPVVMFDQDEVAEPTAALLEVVEDWKHSRMAVVHKKRLFGCVTECHVAWNGDVVTRRMRLSAFASVV